MPITEEQKAAAEQRQLAAAQDPAPQVRVIAGPGTGKSRAIEKRVAHALAHNTNPKDVYVISFTRATCEELKTRVQSYCNSLTPPINAEGVRVRTMHSLALRILRMGNLLNQYPSDPTMLDDWEQRHIYDAELASDLHCAPGRAAEVRLAHDAQWQTLNPNFVNQAQITDVEKLGFNAFHATRANLYSCVLPGEVIYNCVTAFQMGNLHQENLPTIEHLIVDEFQDLNACDQEFIRLLSVNGAALFIAGDDDQSIYSFRHADPNGIINFAATYPQATTHELTDCFRCAPSILGPAIQLISHNPARVQKHFNALYGNAAPPVNGILRVWSFPDAVTEASAVAASCQQLINAGMAGREDEILILISSRRIQLPLLAQELGNLGISYEEPGAGGLADDDSIRAVFALLRLVEEREEDVDDYIGYRTLVGLCSGVGITTAKRIGDECRDHNQNYRALFHMEPLPPWPTGKRRLAVNEVRAVRQATVGWSLQDTLPMRSADIQNGLTQNIFTSGEESTAFIATWQAMTESLPVAMTLEELLLFLRSTSDADRDAVIRLVNQRIGTTTAQSDGPKRVRILTMHGAKGLSGKVVFIPSLEQGILPSFRNLQAAGLVIEHRRLLYVSMTRAMAACIISHLARHTGPQAFALQNRPQVRLPRSQFLTEMGVPSSNRTQGLTVAEAAAIYQDIANL
jgi:DNA helicase II / ATP-dependent DNA helicase PcrA